MSRLVVIETHPVQYHAPVYREIHTKFDVSVAVIYGSDCSIAGYRDGEFAASFAWDTDLLSGYESVFLSRAPQNRSRSDERLITSGMRRALEKLEPAAVLLVGYSPRFHQVAFLEAWRAGVPIVFRGETTDHARDRGILRTYARSTALRLFYASCSRILYVGQHSYEHFMGLRVPPEKLHFSPYCVDTKPFRTSEQDRFDLRKRMRAALAIHSHEVVLLFSGKLSDRKGPDLLVHAVKALPLQVRERIVVVFVGSTIDTVSPRLIFGRFGFRGTVTILVAVVT